MSGKNPWVDAALELHQWGLNPLPAGRGEKHPNLDWRKYQHERVTPQWIRTRFVVPCNYWIVCGPSSGVAVLDCDNINTVRWWREKLGDQIDRVPRVKTALGYHLWFAWEEGASNWAHHANGLDFEVRALGGGVVAPPSIRVADDKHQCPACPHDYVWKVRPEVDADGRAVWPKLPHELTSRLAAGLQPAPGQVNPETGEAGTTSGRSRLIDLLKNPPSIGGRNNWLAQVAGHYARLVHGRRDLYDHFVDEAIRLIDVPHGDDEIAKTRESIWETEMRKPAADPRVAVTLDPGYRRKPAAAVSTGPVEDDPDDPDDPRGDPPGDEQPPAAPPPAAARPVADSDEAHPLTDLGNARRFIRDHHRAVRHVGAYGAWLIWNGRCWDRDDTGEAVRRTKRTIRSIVDEADQAEDPATAAAVSKWAAISQSAERIRAAEKLAATEPEVAISPNQLDSKPRLLNLQNGTYNWQTDEFRTHSPDDLLTKLAGTVYDPDATCPTWMDALGTWLPDPAMRLFVQRAAGYSLTPDIGEKCLFVVWGPRDSGKSVFIETLLHLTGQYGHVVKDDTLILARNKGGNTDDLADLKGIRFASLSETAEGARLDTALVKKITGGSPLTVSRKYERPFTYQPTAHYWVDTNYKPKINPDDDAIWSRLRMIPFTHSLPRSEQNQRLRSMLLAELPGILVWALDGLRGWREHGLIAPDASEQAVAQYRADEDPLTLFLSECYEPVTSGKVRRSALYAAYVDWTGDRVTTPQQLIRRLENRGLTGRTIHGIAHWTGIAPLSTPRQLPEVVAATAARADGAPSTPRPRQVTGDQAGPYDGQLPLA